jgi:hypothetical protein
MFLNKFTIAGEEGNCNDLVSCLALKVLTVTLGFDASACATRPLEELPLVEMSDFFPSSGVSLAIRKQIFEQRSICQLVSGHSHSRLYQPKDTKGGT